MAINDFIQQDSGIMPYVRFERKAIENQAASIEAGHYVAVDIDFVHVTPPGSKDIWTTKATNWMDQLKADVNQGRVPSEWVDKYSAAYQAWKNGQELPLEGTPIRGWGVISPAQQENLTRLNILTVEVLAAMNDEGLRRIGMGAIDLKHKADAWLKQISKAGKPTLEMAALKKENAELKINQSVMESRINELASLVKQLSSQQPYQPMTDAIDSDDLLSDD